MLPVKDSLLLEIEKHENYQICVMDLVSHRGILSYCLAGLRYSSFASFDGLKSPLLKKCFSDQNLYEAVKSSGLVV